MTFEQIQISCTQFLFARENKLQLIPQDKKEKMASKSKINILTVFKRIYYDEYQW